MTNTGILEKGRGKTTNLRNLIGGGASLMRGVQHFFMPKEFRLKWGDYIFKVVFQRGADTIHCWQ